MCPASLLWMMRVVVSCGVRRTLAIGYSHQQLHAIAGQACGLQHQQHRYPSPCQLQPAGIAAIAAIAKPVSMSFTAALYHSTSSLPCHSAHMRTCCLSHCRCPPRPPVSCLPVLLVPIVGMLPAPVVPGRPLSSTLCLQGMAQQPQHRLVQHMEAAAVTVAKHRDQPADARNHACSSSSLCPHAHPPVGLRHWPALCPHAAVGASAETAEALVHRRRA